jgi:C-5 cytosine-specific DNA methylase
VAGLAVLKPRALDLFCGAGGATKGLQLAGFHVTGVDIDPQPDYPGDVFIQADALTVPLEGYDFIWASSPCQEFSVWNMRCFFKNPPFPTLGLKLFTETRKRLETSGIPFVMENVRGACYFVGPAVRRLGPFYFWGSAVPTLFPAHLRYVQKNFKIGRDRTTGKRQLGGGRQFSSHSKARAEWTRQISQIPTEIGEFIGKQVLEHIGARA